MSVMKTNGVDCATNKFIFIDVGNGGPNLAQILTCSGLVKTYFQQLRFDVWHHLGDLHLLTRLQFRKQISSSFIRCS